MELELKPLVQLEFMGEVMESTVMMVVALWKRPESGVAGFGGYYGVYGLSDPTGNDIGIYGEGSRGVYGVGYSGAGVTGHGNSSGVAGYSVASDGVFGSTDNPAGYAGYFNGDVFSSGTYVGSDRTFKKDIADLTSAMDLVNKLQPKSYTFREDGNYKLMHLPVGKHYGLIAQDVEQILPNLVKASTFKTSKAAMPTKPEVGVVPVKGSVTTSSEIVAFKALNYTELIPIVVKGMQEMDAENKMLKQELAELRQMVMDMKNGRGSDAITSAFLEQNNPNPVAGNTIIGYKVPVTTTSARLTITNVKGQLIKTFTIKSVGAGEVDFNSATLATGAYNYSLWIDGKQVDTKRLVIAR